MLSHDDHFPRRVLSLSWHHRTLSTGQAIVVFRQRFPQFSLPTLASSLKFSYAFFSSMAQSESIMVGSCLSVASPAPKLCNGLQWDVMRPFSPYLKCYATVKYKSTDFSRKVFFYNKDWKSCIPYDSTQNSQRRSSQFIQLWPTGDLFVLLRLPANWILLCVSRAENRNCPTPFNDSKLK
jgi:hypothetical protein